VCYELPRFHAEAEVGRRFGFPAFGDADRRRLVKRRLQLNGWKVCYVASLGLGPAAATDKETGFYHSDQRTSITRETKSLVLSRSRIAYR
jgi:hypothetical protein